MLASWGVRLLLTRSTTMRMKHIRTDITMVRAAFWSKSGAFSLLIRYSQAKMVAIMVVEMISSPFHLVIYPTANLSSAPCFHPLFRFRRCSHPLPLLLSSRVLQRITAYGSTRYLSTSVALVGRMPSCLFVCNKMYL